MNRYKRLAGSIGENRLLSSLIFISVLLMFYAAFRLRFGFTNQDGLNYVAIAQNYLAGNLDVAINAYWSPFISWLMVPFLALGFSGTVAFMAVNALAATTALLCGLYLIHQNTKNKVYSILYIVAITPFLMYSISETTPDVWVIAWVLLFVALVLELENRLNITKKDTYIKFGLCLGAIGGFGYFIKLYILPVFVCAAAFFAGLYTALNWSHKKKTDCKLVKNVARLALITFLTLAILMGSWTVFLYDKYHQITSGSSFTHNIGLSSSVPAPKVPGLLPIFPQDPTYTANEKSKRPSGKGIVSYYSDLIKRSTPYYLNNVRSVNIFILPIMLLSLAAIVFGRIRFKEKSDKAIVIINIVFWVYFLGYLLAAATSDGAGNLRYYWPLLPLATIVLIISIPRLWSVIGKEHLWQRSVFIAVVACFPLSIYYQYFLGNDYPFTLRISRDHKIVESRKHGLDLVHYNVQDNGRQGFAKMIASKNIIAPDSKIVGNNKRGMLYIAYETKANAYSYINPSGDAIDSNNYMNDLKTLGIDYYILFSPASENLSLKKLNNIVYETVTKYPCGNTKKAASESCHISIIKI